MFAVTTTSARTWRHEVIGAAAYACETGVMAHTTIDPKSFGKATNGRPTRRGAPPH